MANEADLVIVLLDIARSAEPCSTRHYWFYIVKHFSLIARASLSLPDDARSCLPRYPIQPLCVRACVDTAASRFLDDSVDVLMEPVD